MFILQHLSHPVSNPYLFRSSFIRIITPSPNTPTIPLSNNYVTLNMFGCVLLELLTLFLYYCLHFRSSSSRVIFVRSFLRLLYTC